MAVEAIWNSVQNKLNNIWNEIKNEKLGIDETKKNIIEQQYSQCQISVNIKDEKANSSDCQYDRLCCWFSHLFYLTVYGSQVMMGVMEEKTNRIAEVIVSSVKPFQLMLGKIIGIGLVAFTQFFFG